MTLSYRPFVALGIALCLASGAAAASEKREALLQQYVACVGGDAGNLKKCRRIGMQYSIEIAKASGVAKRSQKRNARKFYLPDLERKMVSALK